MEENTNFKSVALAWLSHKKQYVKKSTFAVYSILVQSHLIPVFGEREDLREEDVQELVNRELERGLSLKTVSAILGHASLVTTMDLYVHPGHEEKKRCSKNSPLNISLGN